VEDESRKYLRYVRTSLADAARLAPDLEGSVRVDTEILIGGRVGPEATKTLFKRAQEGKKAGVDDEQLWPLKILVCPHVFALRPEHGLGSKEYPHRVVPLVLSAKVRKDGKLEADETCLLPLIPREYLEPSSREVLLGTVDEADEIYATLEAEEPTWSAVRACAQELLAKVSGEDPDNFVLDRYERCTYGVCLLRKSDSAVVHIEQLLDVMLKDNGESYPLYEALLTAAPNLPLKSPRELLDAASSHVGQMECGYPLSPSQREALLHHLARPDEAPGVLAVDGPPGTGKTTLLLSAIASLWVQRALDGAEPPLIFATSTNNQAVENILTAFAKVREPDGVLSGRWLAGIVSYGQFHPATTQAETARRKGFHVFESQGGLRHAGEQFETLEGLKTTRAAFMDRFRKAYPEHRGEDMADVVSFLQSRLREKVESMRRAVKALLSLTRFVDLATLSRETCEARAAAFDTLLQELAGAQSGAEDTLRRGRLLRQDWKEHVSSESLWLTALVALGFKSLRIRRDELFCARAVIQHEKLVGDRFPGVSVRIDIDRAIDAVIESCAAQVRTATEAVQAAKAEADSFRRAHAEVRNWYTHDSDGSVASIQGALDVGARFQSFKLATHYWEARYLVEVGEQLQQAGTMEDTKGPARLERLYRRLAKLFHCSVATAYTLPNRLFGWMGNVCKPLFGVIDLLIVDEAGQITPEVGAMPFALARRALVVGDVDQLRPIWRIPAALDATNAMRCGLVHSEAEKRGFPDTPRAVSRSSLMRLAQRATPYSQHPQRGRGMFLSEHRRCWPEIIEICNALVYRGLLVCKRTGDERRIVPSLGYVHIPGQDSYSGRSRYNLAEAAAIAKWLFLRRKEIETAYQDERKSLDQLVAVVTPFVAQAKEIRAALKSEFGGYPGITVGTVDALQGAEYRLVIFSPTYGVATTHNRTRFNQNPSILNVAISRAQDAFLVFGNMHLFKPVGTHPSAVVGRFLFKGGDNELKDVPTELLLPCQDLPPGRLIRDLQSHRDVLAEALAAAHFRVVIVSPFLSYAALEADAVAEKIRRARDKRIRVTVVSDPTLNQNRSQFDRCKQALEEGGATFYTADGPGVHSKLILVDNSWLVVGSFNWLSAVRDARSPYARYESSIRYDGDEAFQMIRDSLKDLKTLIPKPEPVG
jgi:hypothetical protein